MKRVFPIGGFVFLLLIVLSSGGCYYDNVEEMYPAPLPDTTDTTSTTSSVSFQSEVLPVLTTNCATSSGCHGAGSFYPVFESYDVIYAQRDRIKARAVVEKTMPPAGNAAPTQAELDKIETWINDGAPNN